jgi:hypothetical protein
MSALDNATHETRDDGGETYALAHPAGPITMRLIPDSDCSSPLDPDWGDFRPALAMLENGYGRPRYIGTADNVPADMAIDCPTCKGAGELDDETECPACEGFGEVETNDVATYLRATRDAVAVLEIDMGSYGEQSAVLYFTTADIDGAGIPDADAALKCHADEFRRWESGDCWGYACTGPASDDSCWGFIGQEYALEEATAAFSYALVRANAELAGSTYWAARDVETVAS